MEQENIARLHAEIDGHVQGVGFRLFVLSQAEILRLTGWVRNTSAGKVEVVAEGSRPALERFLTKLRQGPRSAYVTSVQLEWLPATGEFDRFSVGRTH